MPKQYFFEAGTFPDLSFTELGVVSEIFGINRDSIHKFSEKIFLIQNNSISDEVVKKVFNRLGGFIRYGVLIEDINVFLPNTGELQKKITFGISILGQSSSSDIPFIRRLSSEIKEELKKRGTSSRFISPLNRQTELNAAQVLRNDIISKGFEFCVIKNEKEEIYGTTLGIQNIEEFTQRDIHKPFTDTKMGTLPPKLARIMVNLAGIKEGILWDPFCGSGTIPMEAAVLGLDVLASDVDENALKYTEENIKWLSEIGQIGNIEYDVFNMDVKNPFPSTLSKLRHTLISAVVCEPFMGPPQHVPLYYDRAEVLLKRVKELYVGLFAILDKIMHEGFVAVVIIPSYKTRKGWDTFGIRDVIGKRWDVLNSKYSSGRDLKWSRKNSIITRNIFILRKK